MPHRPSTNSNEIRILVRNQYQCLLPSKTSLYVHERIEKTDGAQVTNTSFVSNAICYLFEEAIYETNSIEIDRNENVGLTSLMNNYLSLKPGQSCYIQNIGWIDLNNNNQSLRNVTGYFDVAIPLSMIFGFAEDYHKIIFNTKNEHILTSSQSDANAILQTAFLDQYKIEINKIEWLLPNVRLSDSRKLQLQKYIEKDLPIPISF
ncbi:uncharacterized protein LOC117178706 [Belonocnema kinseyi]|uniref:uncharacterized protein LOC117178706 n=1 Tax=Belonocnema kinseyi TaxID=2817044 RepID=UPI00143CE062|nr:uncharacterized protein LOC117178706 [Belonocnema kinseyi]